MSPLGDMSGDVAMEKYAGGVANYRASEGKQALLEARCPVEHSIQVFLGALRSSCTYLGTPTLKALSKCTTFVRVTQRINQAFVRAS